MRRYTHIEINHRDKAKHGADEVNHIEREVLGYDAAGGDAYAYADVPRREVGAGGGGALVVRGEVDVKGVHRREDDAEAYAEEQRHGEEHSLGHAHTVRRNEAAYAKDEKRQHHGVKAYVDALGDVALIHLLARHEARGSHTHSHQCEEKARRNVEMYLLCVHRNEVCRCAVRHGEHQEGDADGDALDKDEAVERELALRLGGVYASLLLMQQARLQRLRRTRLDAQGAQQSGKTKCHAGKENAVISNVVVHEKSRHRAERHGDVVGQAVIAQRLAASAAGRDVNAKGVTANGNAAEEHAVKGAQYDKPREHAGRHIAEEY